MIGNQAKLSQSIKIRKCAEPWPKQSGLTPIFEHCPHCAKYSYEIVNCTAENGINLHQTLVKRQKYGGNDFL